MDITIERILAEMKNQNKRRADLAEFIGVSPNVVTDWKSGRIKSYTKYIHAIAKFLNVSVEYLKGETDKKEKSHTISEEDLKFALWGGDHDDITPKMMESVLDFARFVREEERRKNNDPGKPI